MLTVYSSLNLLIQTICLNTLYFSVDLQDSEEFDMLHKVSLNWSSLKHTATTEIDIAETTRAFWEGNNIQKLAVRIYNT